MCVFGGADLMLPIYDPEAAERIKAARTLIEAMHRAVRAWSSRAEAQLRAIVDLLHLT